MGQRGCLRHRDGGYDMTQDQLTAFAEQIRHKLDIEQRIGKRLRWQLAMCKERKGDPAYGDQIAGLEIALRIYGQEVER